MTDYKKGDYVMYDERELGRVVYVREVDGAIFVCYSTGCTASNTPMKKLRLATDEEFKSNKFARLLGYHRFDDYCPDYDPLFCSFYCPEKRKRG